MFADATEALEFVESEGIQMVDLKTIDLIGRQRHVTIPAADLTEKALATGVGLDTSSYVGYKSVARGDMRVVPDVTTGMIDQFCAMKTLSFICDIVEPMSSEAYARDPRGVAKRAESYFSEVISPGAAVFSPEIEFYLFSDVDYRSQMDAAGYEVDSTEALWGSRDEDMPSLGHRMDAHTGYHAAPPRDQLHDVRSEMLAAIAEAGIPTHYHHHEVGAPGQVEVEVGFGPLLKMADAVMVMKYLIANIAVEWGLSATFMPKPMFGEAGNGMHVHQYVTHEGKSLFWDADGDYANLSEMALNWTGGLLTHAAALLALTSPSTNSYRRLVPGYEAPISAFFGLSNRTAAIRVPAYGVKESENRIEFRPPDATCNPYLCLAAMCMAGLDGVQQGIDPSEHDFGPIDEDVVTLPDEERAKITQLPTSLADALDALEEDHEFLLAGDVFSRDLLEEWISLKREEVAAVNLRPHPHEFVMYYDL
ncbi:MAG: type I glutamate--ammonia ligase [Armatimonadia bacterium]|nr:type I glutamate--ammonia ligase [Armatimonadia bacterium]